MSACSSATSSEAAFADRNVRRALIGSVAGLTVMLFAVSLLIHNPVTAAVGVLL